MSQLDTTEIAENAKHFLLGLLERMDIDAEIEIAEEDDRIILNISCDNVERIIGRRGQVIDSLQHLVSKAIYRERTGTRSKPIIIDAGGYRLKHIERLEALADRMGKRAIKTQSIVELNPMSPHDRRIVHMALANVEGVTTRSEGEGEDRRVLVVPVPLGESSKSAAAD